MIGVTHLAVLVLLPLLGARALHPHGETGPRPALPAGVDSLDETLRPLLDRQQLPALAGAIVRADGLTALGAVGQRSRAGSANVTIADKFHLGSCTKAMTATLLARLIEQEKLQWDTTLEHVFGEAFDIHADYRDVTVEQLLTHRAGTPGTLVTTPAWPKLVFHKGAPADARRILCEYVLTRPPETKPGTRHVYSNAGYVIAGAVAETVTGTDYETLLRQEVFVPLKMASAGFGAPGTPDRLDQPRGHTERLLGGLTPVEPGPLADNPPALAPAGTVHATLADWARFVRAHLQGRTGQSDYLNRETFEKLHTPPDGEDYACGWGVHERDWAGGPALAHAGSNTRWYAVVWAAPQRGFAVLVATNRAGEPAEQACDEAAAALIELAGED
jgi:CubicO group peptidase (beta-lactamase class C family)